MLHFIHSLIKFFNILEVRAINKKVICSRYNDHEHTDAHCKEINAVMGKATRKRSHRERPYSVMRRIMHRAYTFIAMAKGYMVKTIFFCLTCNAVNMITLKKVR